MGSRNFPETDRLQVMDIKIPTKYYILKMLPSVCLSVLIGGLYIGYLLTFAIPLIRKEYSYNTNAYYFSPHDQRISGIIYISVSGFFMVMLLFS